MKSIIDIHTHGIGSYDTRTSNPAHILKIAEIHGRYGVSKIIPTIYPAQIEKMRENMEAVKKAMEMQKSGFDKWGKNKSQITNHQSRVIGIHLEGPFLNHLKSGALDSASFIKPSEYNLKKLIEGFEDNKLPRSKLRGNF
jgi:N-acetylglucosamine-6-phosphate deacetylase